MMSAESKRNIIAEYGEHLQDKLVKDVSEGRNGKLNGDNLDIRVITNDIRMQNKNKDYHFFASDYILDRVDESSMPVLTQTADQPHAKHFLPSADETSIYKDSLKVLLSRVLIQHIPAFSWMKNVAALPVHIPHLLEEAMAKKSTIHMLPVSLNNEVSYEGCIHIMDEYVKMVNSWYSKAGRGGELEDLKIPIGGDQLTRCRLQGAKSLRAGAHTQQERFEQLYPIIIELFHTLQDFLEKLCKKFLKMDHSRNVATLAHLKLVIQRTNVNGQVKARFKAHEDFVTLAGEAYFLAHVMKKFQMSSLDDSPKHQAIPDNIHLLHKQNKQNVANRVMEDIVNDIFIPFDSKSQEKSTCLLNMEMGTWRGQTETSVINNKVKVKVAIGDTSVVLEIPKDTVQKGCSVKLSGIEHHLKIKEQPSQSLNSTADELQDYVVNFLQWYFIIIQLQDAIHEGDVVRTNVLLKQMIPFFYSHSCLSKYFVECIDFILKTEFVLPPHYAMRVRAASFVNVRGGQGQNKAADMHKENEVKLLKDLIKGLGANKTEQSIVAISKAAPVVSSVVDNFDSMLDLKIVKSSHQKRSSKDDILAIINILQKEGLWDTSRVRSLQGFQHMRRSPFSLLDNSLLYRDIERTIQRLQRDLPYIDEEEEENDN
ncbi:uncharacterized protein [Argopecten irradians]|uniref:uncharacterized protein n=1 Tax=Argopecten irradians TaxID=31199 RepID=UPI0037124847